MIVKAIVREESDVGFAAARVQSRPVTRSQFSRRRFLKLSAAAGIAGMAGVGFYGSFVEPFVYEITEREIFIQNLPASFDGFRITQLSDVHHSRLVSLSEVRRVVELTQAAGGDLIALTGDFTTHGRRFVEPCVELIRTLTAPAGVWAVLGNHDHATGPRATTLALERAGIPVLSNLWTEIEWRGERLPLVGVDDWSWGALDFERAHKGLDTRRPSILLSHQPRILDMEPALKHQMILAGHTHGGQIRMPLIGAPVRFTEEFKYVSGLFQREGTQMFVTRGTGVVGLPLRIGAPPEISVIKLRRAEEK
jgi:predicted MPP superfamily phosphohydrolase